MYELKIFVYSVFITVLIVHDDKDANFGIDVSVTLLVNDGLINITVRSLRT
jgi:hypothetical protein